MGIFGGIFKSTAGIAKSTAKLATFPFKVAKGTVNFATGPKGLGLTALLPGKWGGLKYGIPAIGLGLYGLGKLGYGLVGGAYSPYSMTSDNVNYDNQSNRFGSGTYNSYENAPMEFSSFKRSYLDYNATGSLAFALHNRR